MTIDLLIAAGYKEFKPPAPPISYADKAFGKWIRGQDRKLYSIHWYYFSMKETDHEHESWSVEACLYPAADKVGWFSLEYHNPAGTIAEAEEVFSRTYAALACIPDRHNNDE